MSEPTVKDRILHLAIELRRAHTAPVNVRRAKEATALLVAAAGELSVEQCEEIERVCGGNGREKETNDAG